jgi:hypothetical protein
MAADVRAFDEVDVGGVFTVFAVWCLVRATSSIE